MKSFAFFALCYLHFAQAQIEDLFGGELRGDEEIDETLSDIWPKRTV